MAVIKMGRNPLDPPLFDELGCRKPVAVNVYMVRFGCDRSFDKPVERLGRRDRTRVGGCSAVYLHDKKSIGEHCIPAITVAPGLRNAVIFDHPDRNKFLIEHCPSRFVIHAQEYTT